MSNTDYLDPATLRWVADDHAARGKRLEDLHAGGVVSAAFFAAHEDFVFHRDEAKRLRALATRIERKRAALTSSSPTTETP